MEPVLNPEAVKAIFVDCLFESVDGDPPDEALVVVEGILHKYGFDPAKLEKHRAEIVALLYELPIQFHPKAEGGEDGWSFLNACLDRHGRQWTGLHLTMEKLFCLGMAIGRVSEMLPRDMWDVLPGGMPYYGIKAA
jgi:hypothetical protein